MTCLAFMTICRQTQTRIARQHGVCVVPDATLATIEPKHNTLAIPCSSHVIPTAVIEWGADKVVGLLKWLAVSQVQCQSAFVIDE